MVQEDRPLKGRTIVITRPREQAEETVKAIEALGGKAYLFPTIEIIGHGDLSGVKAFFQALSDKKADYVILMSVNGVQHVLNIAETLGVTNEFKKNLKNTVLIAVGPKTAQELEKNGIRVDLVPEKYTSEGILQCLKQRGVKGKLIFIPRTSEAPPELAEQLREMSNNVEEVYVYQSQLPNDRELNEKFVKNLENQKVDAILFSSSLGVRNFFAMLKQVLPEKQLRNLIRKTVVVAIGPTTAKTLTDAGVDVDVMPEKHTLDEALNALLSYWNVQKMSS